MLKQEWKPDFNKDWHKVDLGAYILIYKEAKERMEEVCSESESITSKAIQFIAVLVAVSGFFFKMFIDSKISIVNNWWLILFFILPVLLFSYLVFPKNVKMRGFMPKEFIPKEIHSDDDKGYQEHILYYNSIVNLQSDINYMNDKNENRAIVYKWAMFLSIFMFLLYISSYVILTSTFCGCSS